jgi:putative tryptophan/tyrosine transport system substrate-binding protein
MPVGRTNRRTILAGLGSAIAWPVVARGQQRTKKVIGFLNSGSPDAYTPMTSAFLQGLKEAGYIDSQNVAINYRWAEGDLTKLPTLAAELVELKPDVIVASTTAATMAVAGATNSIPIVSPSLLSPIEQGLAASYARPGGHVTGILIGFDTLSGKQLEIALEVLPATQIIGLLVNPNNRGTVVLGQDFQKGAKLANVQIVSADARGLEDIENAFVSLARARVGFVVVSGDAAFLTNRTQIARLAIGARLPTMFGFREHVEAGGLISYGLNVRENYKRAAFFVGKILEGAKAGDLPIELLPKFELAVNLKTAKALGLEIPPTLLARADEVIE